jgi:hypothetical protein
MLLDFDIIRVESLDSTKLRHNHIIKRHIRPQN